MMVFMVEQQGFTGSEENTVTLQRLDEKLRNDYTLQFNVKGLRHIFTFNNFHIN